MPPRSNKDRANNHAACKKSKASLQGAFTKAKWAAHDFRVEVLNWLLAVETEIKMPWPLEGYNDPPEFIDPPNSPTRDTILEHFHILEPFLINLVKEQDSLQTQITELEAAKNGLESKVKENEVLLEKERVEVARRVKKEKDLWTDRAHILKLRENALSSIKDQAVTNAKLTEELSSVQKLHQAAVDEVKLMKMSNAQKELKKHMENGTARPETGITPGPLPNAASSNNLSASEADTTLVTPQSARHQAFCEMKDVLMSGWALAEDRLLTESKRADNVGRERDGLKQQLQVLQKEVTMEKQVNQELTKARELDQSTRAEVDKELLAIRTELKTRIRDQRNLQVLQDEIRVQLSDEKERAKALVSQVNELTAKICNLEEARVLLKHEKEGLQETLEKEREERAEFDRVEEARIQRLIQAKDEEFERKMDEFESELLGKTINTFKQSFRRQSGSKRKREEDNAGPEALLDSEATEAAKRSKTLQTSARLMDAAAE